MNKEEVKRTRAAYKRRCLGLGLSITVVAKALGVTTAGLRKRFRGAYPIRNESWLALEALEVRIIVTRSEKLLSAKEVKTDEADLSCG